MSQTSLSLLQELFGYPEFRGQQAEIIDHAMGGGSALVLMPTGGGKSLCYQIPALLRGGMGLVVSPLISLMKDQVDALRAYGVMAAALHSNLSDAEARDACIAMKRGELELLYVSPERLLSGLLGDLQGLDISLIAIDEAHCVSQWGHDFRPEYQGLSVLRERFLGTPLLALTATADPHTREDIRHALHLHHDKVFLSSFDRPNIRYSVVNRRGSGVKQIVDAIKSKKDETGIVYAMTRKRVERIAAELMEEGIKAAAYHAGLPADERQHTQDAFKEDDLQVVVATVAFGMGIDKSNVRWIIHADMPLTVEGYYQETGRSGRDGLPAEAILFFSLRDIIMARSLIDRNDNDTQRRIQLHKLNAMAGWCETTTCRRQALLQMFGETLPEPCGNCDVCISPPELFDATVMAQKALSCVHRVDQSFGINHVVQVLRGANTESIRRWQHQELSTYGIGKEESAELWEFVMLQLIHRGMLIQDPARYGALSLTERARPILQREEELWLGKPRPRPVSTRESRGKERHAERKRRLMTEGRTELFEHLRSLRRDLSRELGVPPYIIFNDATLLEMADLHPKSPEELLKISGVGPRKMERFGDEFLLALQRWEEPASG